MTSSAMTQDEIKVWTHLKRAVGREQALARATLVNATGIVDRVVRDIIRTLKIEHRMLICFTQEKGGGEWETHRKK